MLLARHAQAVVPFAMDVPVEHLLELRKREEEAFVRFQTAIHRTVDEARAARTEFTETDARKIYGDIIRPRIAELEQRVQEAKRDLVRKPAATIAGTVAVLGFGFFSGLLTAELGSIVQALGLFKVGHDLTANAVELADVQKSIRRDDMYFLWRVQQGLAER